MGTVTEWMYDRAKEGRRVICIDPVTIIPTDSNQQWRGEKEFIKRTGQIAADFGCSVIFVTHPAKALGNKPSMQALAGSADYARLSQVIMWLAAHDTLTQTIQGPEVEELMPHNRTMHILKVRNGAGQGVQDAFQFNVEGLKMVECGPVTKG
jgi:RecA-family ATPase